MQDTVSKTLRLSNCIRSVQRSGTGQVGAQIVYPTISEWFKKHKQKVFIVLGGLFLWFVNPCMRGGRSTTVLCTKEDHDFLNHTSGIALIQAG
jgi:hypothetical protein